MKNRIIICILLTITSLGIYFIIPHGGGRIQKMAFVDLLTSTGLDLTNESSALEEVSHGFENAIIFRGALEENDNIKNKISSSLKENQLGNCHLVSFVRGIGVNIPDETGIYEFTRNEDKNVWQIIVTSDLKFWFIVVTPDFSGAM